MIAIGKENPGKRFERKFKQSLDLRGYALRIQDKCFLGFNGRLLSEPGEGDFWYFASTGDAYLIECKATKGHRFPLSKLRDEQEESLAEFDRVAHSTHGMVALNYYGEDVRKDNRCVLVPIGAYRRHKHTSGRKSLTVEEAVRLGTECPRIKGNIWELPI